MRTKTSLWVMRKKMEGISERARSCWSQWFELEAEGRSVLTEIRRRSASVCGGARAIAGSLVAERWR